MDKDRIPVAVDRDLEDLIPGFLKRREEDLEKLRAAHAAGDLETVRVTGHSMKGTGGGYGFHGLSEIGAAIERAAKADDGATIATQIQALEDYLSRVEVRFE